ncbi:hypothetical protein DBR06_SOUSAS17610053 [Sousa chinensis]|nr:hypothetical protein DBR06_SOUSAS17610053 [Sousa chinensis]
MKTYSARNLSPLRLKNMETNNHTGKNILLKRVQLPQNSV